MHQFFDLEKAFDSTDTEALWFKMRRNEISDKMLNCIKKMYNGIKFCVKCGEEEVTDCVEQIKRCETRLQFQPLFNIFIDDVTDYLNKVIYMHQK
jgi:D-mannonate dehydratase